jgi:fumarylacetoacetate (FAA) hydrolase family protein
MTAFAPATMLADDWREGLFLGRIETADGPTPVLLKGGILYDMSRVAPTAAQLIADRAFDVSKGVALGDLESLNLCGDNRPYLLSPVDLQCVKAAGVTFAVSAVERVIEERARGDASKAAEVRAMLEGRIGGGIRGLKPGSREAMALKQALIDEGMWSQYLEVAIGPDAEIFTKSPVLSTVGWGAEVGVRSDSSWNNPEPEIAILADSHGEPVGASLGNDVNLRDFEGRSALLLGKAKDNNASCSLGPFVRLFDASFTMDDVRAAQVDLLIEGEDGYVLKGHSSMREISRDPTDLVAQAMSEHHYPDGYILFLGTLFAPTQDRDIPGSGFTHKVGDIVSISTPKLGKLVNRVTHSKDAKPWTLGIGGLMQNLVQRGLLG